MLINILLVGAGGALGSICRYLITLLIGYIDAHPLLATIIANVVGSFIIGMAMTRFEGRSSLFMAVGFCGGFTTFSTFSAQTLNLVSSGQWGLGLAYALGSVVSCVLAVFCAFWLNSKY